MKSIKVIPNKFLPIKKPITATMLHVFLMHYYNAPDWFWGVYVTLSLIIWVLVFVNVYKQEADESLVNNNTVNTNIKNKLSFDEMVNQKLKDSKK